MDNNKIFSQTIKETPNVIYVCDIATYDLYFLNKIARNLCGITEDEDISHRKCYEVIEKRTSPCHYCIKKPLDFETVHTYTVHNTNFNKYLQCSTKAIFVNKRVRLVIGVDVTEAYTERSVNKALLRCIETLYTNKSPEDSITELLRILASFYDGSHGYIMMLSSCGTFLHCAYEWCAEGITPYGNKIIIDVIKHKSLIGNIQKFGVLHAKTGNKKYFGAALQKSFALNNVKDTVQVPLYNKHSEFIGIVGVNDPRQVYGSHGLLESVCKFIADFVEKTQLIGKLNLLSYTDALSNLKNRHSYAARLELFEASPPSSLGVVYLDINGLKELNDRYGHVRGDGIIAALGQILQEIFGNDAYRIGGDEFIVLRDDVEQEEFEKQVKMLMQSVNEVHNLSISIGYIWNDVSVNVSQQIENADSRMYSEKLVHYQNNSKNVKYRTVLRNALAADIRAGKFVVFLQPQVNLADNSLSGAEALLRKVTPTKSLDYPAYFIPLYERLEIVHYLDLFVFKTVCMTLEKWNKLGYDYVSISVNMSRVTLQQPGIVERIVALCAEHGIEHHQIIVEVTETIQSQSSEYLSKVLLSIAAQGFMLSLDDFGSGYSSLLTLAKSEFGEIKIDREFIQDLHISQRSQALVRYTINMCNELNIAETVAEGIETQEVCDILKSIDCAKGQGYFFNKPMPIAEFSEKYLLSASGTA